MIYSGRIFSARRKNHLLFEGGSGRAYRVNLLLALEGKSPFGSFVLWEILRKAYRLDCVSKLVVPFIFLLIAYVNHFFPDIKVAAVTKYRSTEFPLLWYNLFINSCMCRRNTYTYLMNIKLSEIKIFVLCNLRCITIQNNQNCLPSRKTFVTS